MNANHSLECSLIWTASNLYEYHTLLPTFDYYSQHLPPALAVCLSDAPVTSTPKFVGLFVQNPVIEHFGDFTAFMDFKARRYDATKFDTSLAKIWLHCCEEWHGVTCQFALMLRGDPAPRIGKFRLIDVVSQ